MREPSIEALVSSRICHDLISPVGAIGNGIELLEELADSMPEIGLIADSVENAKNKLRFFRICFGQSTLGAMSGVEDISAVATDMLQTSRLGLQWHLSETALPREEVKLLFLMLLCAETALPVGGTISIARDEDQFVITARGKRVQRCEAWDVLDVEKYSRTITPARVQFPLSKALAAELGRKIQMEEAEAEMTIRF